MNSQKIKVLIVNDVLKSRSILQTMIADCFKDVTIVGQANSIENAQFLISLRNPDLVILDLEMPFFEDFSLLEISDKNNFEVVFISAFDHYALKSIQYHVLDYLLKPIDLGELVNAIKKVKAIKYSKLKALASNVQSHRSKKVNSLKNKLSISTQNGKEYISIEHILYCEADGPCTWIHMSDGGKYYSSKNLGLIEKMLEKHAFFNFFRSHYAYLINLLKVKSFYLSKNLLELENGVEVTIAQRRKKNLRAILKPAS